MVALVLLKNKGKLFVHFSVIFCFKELHFCIFVLSPVFRPLNRNFPEAFFVAVLNYKNWGGEGPGNVSGFCPGEG